MSDSERAMIANAIWLCRDCHGLIDRDVARYPAELLLHWKSHQEEAALQELGKTGELLRYQLARKETDQLGDIPLFIKKIVEEKGDFWEYMATAELLEFYLSAPIRKATQLKRGLYSKARTALSIDGFAALVDTKTSELMDVLKCLQQILAEIMVTWGEPGQPGNALDIVHACRLYGECAQRFVDIAEDTMFVKPPSEFEALARHLARGALYPTERLLEVPAFIRSITSQPNPKGVFRFSLVIELPDGWAEEADRLMNRGFSEYRNNHS